MSEKQNAEMEQKNDDNVVQGCKEKETLDVDKVNLVLSYS